MSQMLQLDETQVDSLAEVCRRYGVKELFVFGSAVRGEMGAQSDVDIMVEFEPGVRIGLIKFESLVEQLESLFGRRVRIEALDTFASSQRCPAHLCGMSRRS